MNIQRFLSPLALLTCVTAQAQTIRAYDVRSANLLTTGATGTADFHVRAMNISFENTSLRSYDDFLDNSLRRFLDNYNSSNYTQAVDFAKDLFDVGTWEAKAVVATVYVYASGLIQMLQGMNVGHREYLFVCPVAGRYEITVTMTGSLVKPRNRVHLAGPAGSYQIDEDNPRYDYSKTYNLDLPQGAHVLTMSMGSGASATFDSAGTMDAIRLNHPTYLDWKDVVPIKTQSQRTVYDMASPGSASTIDYTWPIPRNGDFINLLDGTILVDRNTIQLHAIHSQIDSKLSVNVKNCYGDTTDLPARFLNADLSYLSRPPFWFEGNFLRTRQTVVRQADQWLAGTFTVCNSSY